MEELEEIEKKLLSSPEKQTTDTSDNYAAENSEARNDREENRDSPARFSRRLVLGECKGVLTETIC